MAIFLDHFTDADNTLLSAHTPDVGPVWSQVATGTPGGTSTTSLLIGVGSKTFTTNVSLSFPTNSRCRAYSTANNANWMEGPVTSDSATTLVINVDTTSGSGTLADWNFVQADFEIIGNQLTKKWATIVHAFVDAGTPEVSVSANFTSLQNLCSLIIRRQDSANYWELFYNYAVGWQLDKVVGSVDNNQGPLLLGSTGTVSLSASGNVITARGPDGSTVQVIDATFNTATKVGLILDGFGGVASSVDDFTVNAARDRTSLVTPYFGGDFQPYRISRSMILT